MVVVNVRFFIKSIFIIQICPFYHTHTHTQKQTNKQTNKQNKTKFIVPEPEPICANFFFFFLKSICRVTICSPNLEELGYKPNEPNTINL